MKNITAILVFLTTTFLYSQNDKIIGNVKSIREKTILYKLKKEERKEKAEAKRLGMIRSVHFSMYGEDPIHNPRSTENRAIKIWYNYPFAIYLNYYKKFDVKSRLIEEKWYENNNKLKIRYDYKYNEFDSIIEIKVDKHSKKYFEITLVNYNFDNTKSSSLNYYHDSPNNFNSHYLKYNENKKLIEISKFDKYGFTERISFDYFDTKNSFKKIIYNPKEIIETRNESLTKIIDTISTKKLIETNMVNEKNKIVKKIFNKNYFTEYEYDDVGNLIDQKKIINDTIRHRKEYKYDEKNRIVKLDEISLDVDEMNTEINFFYDETKLMRFTYKDKNKLYDVELKYKFDKHNNWIEQTKFVNGEKTIIRKRKIEYYN